MENKTCKKCNETLTLEKFRHYKNKSIRNTCKKCDNENDKLLKINRRKKYNETTIVDCDKCNIKKPLIQFTKLKKYYKKKICKTCYPLFLKENKNSWCANERKRNINYRLKKSLAARLRTVVKKENHTMIYIGCNIQFLRKWFEYNFTTEMNWDNYGNYWSIDHVVPVSTFNLTIEEQKMECWNWSNLVPVSISYNSSKKNILDLEQINKIKENLKKFKEECSETKWFSGK